MCTRNDLASDGLLRITGTDVRDFLQGQFCNNVDGVDEARHQLNGWCNPKGRLLAVFRLFRHDGALMMQLPAGLLDPVTRRLRMFVLRSDVTIEDASVETGRIGLWGAQARACLIGATDLESAPAPGESVASSGLTVLGLPETEGDRFGIVGDADRIRALEERLSPETVSGSGEEWRLRGIRSGLPVVYPGSSEQFVPQMVNMDLVDALSFSKGCYPGQEIVARTRYLGKLKRRMFRLAIETETPPEPGADVYSTRRENDAMGTVVDAAPVAGGLVEALAVLRLDDIGAADLHVGAPEGPSARIVPLPYNPLAPAE